MITPEFKARLLVLIAAEKERDRLEQVSKDLENSINTFAAEALIDNLDNKSDTQGATSQPLTIWNNDIPNIGTH